MDQVAQNFRSMDRQEKRARALLQALGIMDIDILSEYRAAPSSALAAQPHFDELGSPPYALVAHRCANCGWAIRSYHFYECADGCRMPRDPNYEFPFKRVKHAHIDTPSWEDDPFRLCPACLSRTTHDAMHDLKVVRAFPKASVNTDHRRAARKIDEKEHTTSLQFLGFSAVDELGAGAPAKKVFPEGNTHAALAFGPLLIEIGATSRPSGALVSLRSLPPLGVDPPQEVEKLIADDDEWAQVSLDDGTEGGEVLTVVECVLSQGRMLYTRRRSRRERRFLRCEKQIAGGLFTSHGGDRSIKRREDDIVGWLIQYAHEWQRWKKTRLRNEKDRPTKLKEFAKDILRRIQDAWGPHVKTYLKILAARLLTIRLDYDMLTNNCQRFCDNMLSQFDYGSIYFHGHYPHTIPWLRRRDPNYPTYLMSFARSPKTDPINYGLPGLGKFQSTMQLHACVPHNAADAIDHAASVRYKTDANNTPVWRSATCHDDILLKATPTTCKLDRDRGCTLADHLLDCPFDNLCVLSLHVHREMRYYTTTTTKPDAPDGRGPYERLFALAPGRPADPQLWIINRLRVLHRLITLNALLSATVRHFDRISVATLPNEWTSGETDIKEIKPWFNEHWAPRAGCLVGRAWHYQLRRAENNGIFVYVPHRLATSVWPSWYELDIEAVNRAWDLTLIREDWLARSTLGLVLRNTRAAVNRMVSELQRGKRKGK